MAKKGLMLFVRIAAGVLLFAAASPALTRWSANHFIPDADFIEGWRYIGGYTGYFSMNEDQGSILKHAGFCNFGLSEWANIEGGYAGGFTMGVKVKVLNESDALPSTAIGVTNLFANKEAYWYDTAQSTWKNEYFVVFGKSINPIRLRLHAGFTSMIDVKDEAFDPFFGVEKYLGGNAYLTLETFYRDNKLHPSLFGTLRLFDQRFEFTAGVLDILGLFNGGKGSAMTFSSPRGTGLVRPGIWFALRYNGRLDMPGNPFNGFGSLEEQQKYQQDMLKILKRNVDSLNRAIIGYDNRIDEFKKGYTRLADSAFDLNNSVRLRNLAVEQITVINGLYGREDFDASKLTRAKKVLLDYGDVMVPFLKEIVLDNRLDRKMHAQAMSILGEMATQNSADAILDIMGQTQDADVKIEGIVAIGKARDKRAAFLLDQLAYDANTTIAFAATEVLRSLENRAPRRPDAAGKGAPQQKPVSQKKGASEQNNSQETWDKFLDTDGNDSTDTTDGELSDDATDAVPKSEGGKKAAPPAAKTQSAVDEEEDLMSDLERSNIPPAPPRETEFSKEQSVTKAKNTAGKEKKTKPPRGASPKQEQGTKPEQKW